MATDIHVHTEIKVDGVWHHYSQPRIGRSYWLFALMAGVRTSEASPQALFGEPRGLPEGLSFTTKLDADKWGGDGHDHSWLTGAEMAKVIEKYDAMKVEELKKIAEDNGKEPSDSWYSLEYERFGYFFGNGWDISQLTRGESYPACVEDVRVVFWFDC